MSPNPFYNHRRRPIQRKRSLSSVAEDDFPLARRARRTTSTPVIDSDDDWPNDTVSAAPRTEGNATNKPIIISDSESPPSSPTQNKKKTISGPIMISPPVSLPADRIKTETGKRDSDSETEEERELLLAQAKMYSAAAKVKSLKTRKTTREARKMRAVLASSMSDTKGREAALRAVLVKPNEVLDEELNELYGVLERYDDWIMDLSKKTEELGEMAERRKRLKEFINLIEEKVSGGCCLLMTLELGLTDSVGRFKGGQRILIGKVR